ncbi:hypothetical protein EC991_005896 [Linnemannia zychae]|nr:hypothetical protein EC991_005896 [Linnemannia zychae]
MEHCERYQPLFVQFAARGMEVQAFDLPGFGETGAREDAYGITGGYDVLLKEIDAAIDRAQDSHPQKPIFLMGHGMGGALVLNYVSGLGQRTPLLAVTAEELTRDLSEQERFLNDGLIRDSVSLQCLGDMIYQGQKMLKKRWKKFPPPLPTLLLHGTDDPICSYQATHTLATQLLKLQPRSFLFKSWKGNMHDPHWDLDAHSVRSEFTSWIRNNCRHFDQLPLEPSMVHWDSIRSSRSATASTSRSAKSNTHSSSSDDGTSSKDKKKDKKREEKKLKKKEEEERKKAEKAEKADKKKQKKLSTANGGSVVDGTQVGSGGAAKEEAAVLQKTLSNPANAEPEAIQDLEGLRRLQEQSKLKAIEKRREYNLETPDSVPEAEQQQELQEQQQGSGEPALATIVPSVPPMNEQGVIPTTIVTEAGSTLTTTPPPQQPLSTNPSTSATTEQLDPVTGLQTAISRPIVKEQSDMEKSLEAIALTLSRENSLNNLPRASEASASASVSSETTEVKPIMVVLDQETRSPIASDVPVPLEQSAATTTDTTTINTPATVQETVEPTSSVIENPMPAQGQQQETTPKQDTTLTKADPVVFADDTLVHVPTSTTLQVPGLRQSVLSQSMPSLVAATTTSMTTGFSLPGQFPVTDS